MGVLHDFGKVFLWLRLNPKSRKIMNPNIKTSFLPSERGASEGLDSELQCYSNQFDEIYISIERPSDDYAFEHIVLDVPTAIKLSKVLRAEIAEIKKGSGI